MMDLVREMNRLRLLEFFLIGVVLGLVEDVIAIALATETKIDLKVILIALFVAFPFAVLSELVVDLKKFPRIIKRILKIDLDLP